MLVRDRVARPGASFARRSASQKVSPSRVASAWTHSTARSPMPRLGALRIRCERDHVVGVDQQPQVGQRVADLAPLVEAHPADHPVGLAGADEHLLEDPRLGVGAVEDRDVGGPGAAVGELVDLVGDEPRLVVLVVGDVADDPLAVAGVGPQLLLLAALVVADHRVGGGEDGLGGAVVLLQQDRGGVGEVLLEVEDVADVGAAEGVDRLVGVADHHQLGRLDPLAPGARRRRGPRTSPRTARGSGRTGRGWCPGTRRPARAGTGAGRSRARRGTAGTGGR